MAVTPRGEDIATALRAWIADEITEAPKRIFELGKFLFGVSSGSVGVFVSVSKFSENTWGGPEWWSLGAFVVSGAIALYVAMPSLHKLHGAFDLAEAQSQLVLVACRLMIAWGIFWTAAVVLAGLGLLNPN